MNDWISANPEVLGGKPCVRGTRLSVEFILELMATGAPAEAINETYPQVPVAAVQAALAYAARAMRNDVVGDEALGMNLFDWPLLAAENSHLEMVADRRRRATAGQSSSSNTGDQSRRSEGSSSALAAMEMSDSDHNAR